jgi:hypothetical protein
MMTGRAALTRRASGWQRVWACPDHLEGLTGMREFGRATSKLRGRPEPAVCDTSLGPLGNGTCRAVWSVTTGAEP